MQSFSNFKASSFNSNKWLCNLISSTSYFFLSSKIFFSLFIFSTFLTCSTNSCCKVLISLSNSANLTLPCSIVDELVLFVVDKDIISSFNVSIFFLEVWYISLISVISSVI